MARDFIEGLGYYGASGAFNPRAYAWRKGAIYGAMGAIAGGVAGIAVYASLLLLTTTAPSLLLASSLVAGPAITCGLAFGLIKGIGAWKDSKDYNEPLDM